MKENKNNRYLILNRIKIIINVIQMYIYIYILYITNYKK